MSKTSKFFPVSSPDIGELENQYVTRAVSSGWVSSIGEYVDQFEARFAEYCGLSHAVSMANGTDALFIALKALGIEPGDEVIVPSLTFVAVSAVVVHHGATPVIVDVDPDYWCIDPVAIDRAITSKTKAIIAVHSYGHPADMDPILEVARKYSIKVIEDCAEAHGATYKGKIVGSIGDVGCFSFYGNKIITTGEGGIAVTNDPQLASRMRFYKDHAMDPERRYFHPEVGYNCRITNLQAALGCAQLDRIKELDGKRSQILTWYKNLLQHVPEIKLNPVMSWAKPVNWMVCLVLSEGTKITRDALMMRLRESGIDSRPFFLPTQTMPPYSACRTIGRYDESTPIADRLSKLGLNLPSSSLLDEESVRFIGNVLLKQL